MQHTIEITLPTEIFQPLNELALREGQTLEQFAAEKLAKAVQRRSDADELAEVRFARHFGAISSGDSRSADNDKIDADLIRAYADANDNV